MSKNSPSDLFLSVPKTHQRRKQKTKPRFKRDQQNEKKSKIFLSCLRFFVVVPLF